MKTRKSTVILSQTLIAVLFLASCSDLNSKKPDENLIESVSSEESIVDPYAKLYSDLKALNTKYNVATIQTRGWFGKWLTIIASDAIGAAIGFHIGGPSGAFFLGAECSAIAYHDMYPEKFQKANRPLIFLELNYIRFPQPGAFSIPSSTNEHTPIDGNLPVPVVPELVVSDDIKEVCSNLGACHNNAIYNFSTVMSSDFSIDNVSQILLLANQIYGTKGSGDPLDRILNELRYQLVRQNYEKYIVNILMSQDDQKQLESVMKQIIDEFPQKGENSESVARILSNYFQSVESMDDINKIESYSKDLYYTIASTEINDIDKNNLLIMVSVGANSKVLWNSVRKDE